MGIRRIISVVYVEKQLLSGVRRRKRGGDGVKKFEVVATIRSVVYAPNRDEAMDHPDALSGDVVFTEVKEVEE